MLNGVVESLYPLNNQQLFDVPSLSERGAIPSTSSSAMAQQSPQSQPSLPSLPAHLQSDTHITAHLASRFHLSLPTATISSQAIVSLNTFTTPNVVGVELEGMANRMWRRLGGRGENQVAVFL